VNPIFGRSNNPWDLGRTPGGSTGGGAAAVATGLSPLELGSDIGGSVRIPAHYCGIYALKPTEYRVPTTGHIPDLPDAPKTTRYMNTIGPLARSLDDLELAIRLIAGPDGIEYEVPPAQLDTVATPALADLRLAWADDFGGAPIAADTSRALAALASALADAGVWVEQRLPDGLDFELIWEMRSALGHAQRAATMTPEEEARYIRERGYSPESLSPTSDDAIERGLLLGRNATVRDLAVILNARDAQVRALERFFDEFDALLCPVTSTPAIAHCPTGSPIAVDGREIPYMTAGSAYTAPFNFTGHPAVIVPLAQSVEGLPIGLQIVGPRWGELRILAVASALEPYVRGYRQPPGY
jgi:amidase